MVERSRAARAERDAQDRGESRDGWDRPGAASSPHRPVKTTSVITRGLVSANRSRQSAGRPWVWTAVLMIRRL